MNEHDQQDPQRTVDAALAAEAADEQGLLFTDDVSPLPSDTGYRGPTACNAAGITYRQLDYWARTGLVEPTVRSATGSGSQRLYSFRDILILKVIKRLLDAGISLQQIRTAVSHLRERGTDDLTRVTLMSDGASVYECTSNDEVIDLLQGGQGVFGIAIGGVWREIEGTLAELPSERTAVDESRPPATSCRPRRAARQRASHRVRLAPLTIPHGRVFGPFLSTCPGRRRGNSSPEPLRRQGPRGPGNSEVPQWGRQRGRVSDAPLPGAPMSVPFRAASPSPTVTSACAGPTSSTCSASSATSRSTR